MASLPLKPTQGIALTYNLRFVRQTLNFYVFEYAKNPTGGSMLINIRKTDVDLPLGAIQRARMTVEF